MRCPYCGIEYAAGETCFCHAPVEARTVENGPERVKGPWGEAERGWTEKGRPDRSVMK